VFRIGRGVAPFEPTPWEYALPDGTFGNRFDDPSARRNVPEWERFRAVYCATQRAACFGETLARFRRSLALEAALLAIDDDEPLLPEIERPYVTADWRAKRRMGKAYLDPSLRFADFGNPETWQRVRPVLAPIATALGLGDIDLSAVTGSYHILTQEFARHVFDQEDNDGRPLYAGIRYISRLHPDWECWAIYDSRMVYQSGPSETIYPDDPDLIAIARLFGLAIETFHGHTVDP